MNTTCLIHYFIFFKKTNNVSSFIYPKKSKKKEYYIAQATLYTPTTHKIMKMVNLLCTLATISIFVAMHSYLPTLILTLLTYVTIAQKPTLTISQPTQDSTTVTTAKQYITGTTTASSITINGTTTKVYATGVYAYQASLAVGSNVYVINAVSNNKSTSKRVVYTYLPPKLIRETDSAIIETITTEPSGDVVLQPGEYIKVKVKAKPNCTITLNQLHTLTEIPKSQTKGIAGYYQYNYKVTEANAALLTKINLQLYQGGVLKHTKTDKSTYSLLPQAQPLIVATNAKYTAVYSGLGQDRLGGTKAGYLDSGVLMQVIGRVNNMYKVQWNSNYTVYLPTAAATVQPNGTPIPSSLSNNVSIVADSLYEYIRISLATRLPYTCNATTTPSQLILNVYGATSNTNWVTQYPTADAIVQGIDVVQLQDGLLQLQLQLPSQQLWGYSMYYEGTTLVLQVRKPKPVLTIPNMLIAIDAGHGGSNLGALGLAGRYEKEFTLLLAKELEVQLLAQGATIIMTRDTELSYENQARLTMLRRRKPDFAISLHLNSADDHLRVKGTSTYYKYTVYQGLSKCIYTRLKETGLAGWGNIGNFNFFMNSATEFPTSLVEALFLSNPEDEEKIHDAAFRKLLCQKIVLGIKDWLQNCAVNK